MFAIVEIGGKQYMIKETDTLRVDKMPEEAGKTVSLSKVLLISGSKETKIGAPYLSGASVDVKVVKTGLNKKDITFKMKSKKRYKRHIGHREPYTEIEILKIKA